MSLFGEVAGFDKITQGKTHPPKTHEFLFVITDPPDVAGTLPVGNQFVVTLSTDSVEISAFDIETEEFKTSSVTVPFATGIDYSSITVGLTEQTAHAVLGFLSNWKDLMFNTQSAAGQVLATQTGGAVDFTVSDVAEDTVNPLSTYARTAQLFLIESNGISLPVPLPVDTSVQPVTGAYHLDRIFPMSVEPVNYDYSDDGEAISYQVEFAVHTIDTITITSPA